MKVMLLIACFFCSILSYSQTTCAFDVLHARRLEENATYRKNVLTNEARISEFVRLNKNRFANPASKTNAAPYTIPVVVHVMHTGGAEGTIYNPADAQIQGAIDYLNQVYNGTYPGTEGVGDIEIQFALAQRDPNCNPTTGINRVDASAVANYVANGVNAAGISGTDELNIKNLIRWNVADYYNIWIVNKIDGADGTSGSFIAGFAYFPGASPSLDGTVMLASQMVAGEKTLPHEIGHAFYLYHPFQGSSGSTCPANTDCTSQGDGVCDTDPITQPAAFACRTGVNSCTSTNYSINTERNYMNYTNCYTLFTAGQKTRMIAAAETIAERISLTTSLGATAPGAGSVTCNPKINFQSGTAAITEQTITGSGCRFYRDFTYQMSIGSAPTTLTTATLAVSGGTATEGVDYDITTNGDFTTPSKVLTFPAGSSSMQSFTVRLYNDAGVETSESVTLDFSINNGGGNAEKGTGNPTLVFTISDNDVAPVAGGGTSTATIGTAAYLIDGSPFDARLQKQKMHVLYRASEMSAQGIPAGSISGISLNLQKASTRIFTGFTIKMGSTAFSNLIDGGISVTGGMVTVKSAAAVTTVNGWNEFLFDAPFTWNGTSNIVIEICWDNGSADAGNFADRLLAFADGGSTTQGNIFWENGKNCSESFSSVSYYNSGVKPIIRFNYGITGTPVQSVLNRTKTEYLGPFSDVYVYDDVDGRLMGRIRNLSAHNYGCTQIIIDRTGTGATAFNSSTTTQYLADKTFRVIPSNNNATGSYEITLYYTQSEIDGWQTATGQSFNNMQLVKTSGPIADATPADPNGAGLPEIVIPSRGSLGTNRTLTYTFSTGFSGFGAGIPSQILLVTELTFKGRLFGTNAILEWSTENEVDLSHFEVQRSDDGISYKTIGRVHAKGGGSKTYYNYTDNFALSNNYYRLKSVDLDGSTAYSRQLHLYELSSRQQVTLLQNPVTADIHLRLHKPGKEMRVELHDLSGRCIFSKTFYSAGPIVSIPLNGQISSGTYILRAIVDSEVFIHKVVKQ